MVTQLFPWDQKKDKDVYFHYFGPLYSPQIPGNHYSFLSGIRLVYVPHINGIEEYLFLAVYLLALYSVSLSLCQYQAVVIYCNCSKHWNQEMWVLPTLWKVFSVSPWSITCAVGFVYCCSVAQSCPTLCDPVDCRTPGFPVVHHLPLFVQTHIHWVDAIQPSHPFLPPFLPPLTQHQGLFQWVGSSQRVARVLELQLQHQAFQWIFRVDFLYDWVVWFSKGLSGVFSITPAQKHQFLSVQMSLERCGLRLPLEECCDFSRALFEGRNMT